MKKKNNKWIIWLIAAIVIGGGLWFYFKNKENVKIELETVQPEYGDLSESITATGKIEPVDTVAVGTQVSGTIKNIYVDFNSKVKKGQLLATLDPDLLRASMLQMSSNLQNAKSNLAYNQTNYSRQAQLYKVGAISKADYDNATNQFNAAKAQVGAVSAQLAAANKNLSFTNIYSPIDGTVLNRNVSEGQTVAASFSTPTLFSIAKDLSKMQVRASIDEADIGNVVAGQKVNFTVDAFPDEIFNGSVSEVRLQPTVSANVVNYITMINADNSSLKLKPGMTANITVITKEFPKVLKIPTQATSFHPDSLVAKNYKIATPFANKNKGGKGKGQKNNIQKSQNKDEAAVWILGADNSLSRKKIQIGIDNDTEVQVISGLTEKDKVVTGYKTLSKTSSGSSGAKSPFLPQRPGGNKGGNRSGGGSGGGGPRN